MMLVRPSADSGSALKILILLIAILIGWMFKPVVMNWYMMQKYKAKRKRAMEQGQDVSDQYR